MTTPLLLAALLASAQALPQPAIGVQGFTTSPNGPSTEEPCIQKDVLVTAPELQVYPCNMEGTPAKALLTARQTKDTPCTSDAECSGPWCIGGGVAGVCGEEGKCVCKQPRPIDQESQGPALDHNSEEWKKINGMDEVDGCNLFDVIKCEEAQDDVVSFSLGACLSVGKSMFMDVCMPLFLALSKEDQDKKLAEISDVREEQEEKQEEGWEKEKERLEEEAKKKEERAKKEQEEIDEWKKDNPIWVKESGASNTVVTIGDGKINFGSLDPWDIISKIPEKCPGQACKAGGSSFSFETVVHRPKDDERTWKDARKGQLVMSIDGSWDAAQTLGSRDQLLAAVKMTLDALDQNGKIEKKEKARYMIGPCNINPRTQVLKCAERTGGLQDLNKVYEVNQWTMTDEIQVRVTNGPAGEKTLAGWISIGFELQMPEASSGIGFCSGAISAGAGIAAMFAPPAGPAVAAGMLIGAVFCGFGS